MQSRLNFNRFKGRKNAYGGGGAHRRFVTSKKSGENLKKRGYWRCFLADMLYKKASPEDKRKIESDEKRYHRR